MSVRVIWVHGEEVLMWRENTLDKQNNVVAGEVVIEGSIEVFDVEDWFWFWVMDVFSPTTLWARRDLWECKLWCPKLALTLFFQRGKCHRCEMWWLLHLVLSQGPLWRVALQFLVAAARLWPERPGAFFVKGHCEWMLVVCWRLTALADCSGNHFGGDCDGWQEVHLAHRSTRLTDALASCH